MQFLQKEWVENQPTPTFDKEPKRFFVKCWDDMYPESWTYVMN